MKSELTQRIMAAQKKAIGEILTFGEVALPPRQFKAFKKLIFELYHERLRPETIQILQSTDQPRAVPNNGNIDRKECAT